MPTMNISLTPELVKLIKAKVKSGMYNNASEFIREAVRGKVEVQDYLYELKLARLKEQLAVGVAQIEAGNYREYSRDALLKDIRSTRIKKSK